MIISQNGRLAVADLLISFLLLLFGGQVDSRIINQRQTGATTQVYFATDWPTLQDQYAVNNEFKVAWTVGSSPQSDIVAAQGNLSLALLWTSATSGTPDSSNTFYFQTTIAYACEIIKDQALCNSYKPGSGGTANISLLVTPSAAIPMPSNGILGGFFFCFSTAMNQAGQYLVCESFSKFFELTNLPPQAAQRNQKNRAVGNLQVPTAALALTRLTNFIYPSGSQAPIVAPQTSPSIASPSTTGSGISTSARSTVYGPPTGTTTITPSATSATSAPTGIAAEESKSSKGGLGTGPIVGIAIGGVALLVIALLVIFFCCRRRQRKRTQPEQVLLRHNVQYGSRDLMAEKEGSEGPMLGSMLETLPPSGPYDHLSASAPYSGNAGPGGLNAAGGLLGAAAIPRRTPTSATQATQATYDTNISRGISDASGPISPRSTVRGGDADFEGPYHDEPVPVYGDARHVPRVYAGSPHAPYPSSSPTPFLSEPGMTDEELTRLEEEERRIDAAIAEAERRRR